jgi:hypothetical protein
MALVDASYFQDWVRAVERSDRAHRLYDAAGPTGNRALIEEMRKNVDLVDRELNAAVKAINEHYPN